METITIDTLGDVQLIVDNDNVQVVGRPKFPEGKAILEAVHSQQVPVDIHLHDDDVEALESLLNIIHLRPTRISDLEGLIQLAFVVDKYHAAGCIDLDLDWSVRAILAARTGPTLQDLEHGSENLDWRQIRSPAPCAQDNMFAKYSYQVLWLFGHVLGCRFLEGPEDWAGNKDSFEWCMGEALKEAAAVAKEGE